MNSYIFIFYESNEPEVCYIRAENEVKALKEFIEISHITTEDIREAYDNHKLFLYSRISDSNGYIPNLELDGLFEDIDLEFFLDNPYQYMRDCIKDCGFSLDNLQFHNSDMTEEIFNFLSMYLIANRPDLDKYYLIFIYNQNNLYVPYLIKTNTPISTPSSVSLAREIIYNDYLEIRIYIQNQ